MLLLWGETLNKLYFFCSLDWDLALGWLDVNMLVGAGTWLKLKRLGGKIEGLSGVGSTVASFAFWLNMLKVLSWKFAALVTGSALENNGFGVYFDLDSIEVNPVGSGAKKLKGSWGFCLFWNGWFVLGKGLTYAGLSVDATDTGWILKEKGLLFAAVFVFVFKGSPNIAGLS